jgi:predicted Zn-dependent peptidase
MTPNANERFHTEYSELLRESCISATHPSGLEIRLVPKSTETYAIVLAIGYGALDRILPTEPNGEETPQGTAHFLEHQLFGSEDDEQFARLGAEVNAFTSYDRTAYTAGCTDRFEEVLFRLLSMVMHPTFDATSVEKERPIIAEEIRMNQDSPWDRCYANLLRAMYRHHGIRDEICGSEASIADITADTLRVCHQAFYTPSNMVLAVSGRTSMDVVWQTVDRVFGAYVPSSVLSVECPRSEPDTVEKSYVVQYMPHIDEKAVFCIGVKDRVLPVTPEERLKKELIMTILSDMLFSRSGRFYNELFEEGLVASGFSGDSAQGDGYALYALTGEADDPQCVFERFKAYVDSLYKNGLPREEFERSQRVLYANFVTGFDSTEDIVQSLMNDTLDGLSVFDFLRVSDEITFEDVEREFKENFCSGAYTLSVVHAGDPDPNDTEEVL